LVIYIYNPCFGCLSRWGASKIGHTTDLYSNAYSFDTTRHKSMKIHSLHTIIHSLHIKIYIFFTQGHNKTYNSITAQRRCRCHRPRQILPCLEPYRWSRIRPTKKDAWRHKWMSKQDIRHLLVLRMEQLKVGTNDLPSVAKKKVATSTTSVSSTETFPTTGLALQLRCPRRWRLVSLARRWGRSGETLAWMIGWRRWQPVSSWRRWQPVSSWRRWWWPRRRLPDCGKPSPQHHRCWTRTRTL
jgi:hypothetical protein